MLLRGKILICLFSGLVAAVGVRAVVPDLAANPYRKIANRNIFNLSVPPPVITNVPPVLPRMMLTGMTTILRMKQALLWVQTPAHRGEPAREGSYILAEGEQAGGIEVLEINEAARTVVVKTGGVLLTLHFDDHSATPPTLLPPPPPTPFVLAPASTLGPDEQVLVIEAQRAKALIENDPVALILPLTELTSEVLGENPSPR